MVRAIIFDCFGVIVGQGFDHTYSSAGGDPRRDREFINDMLRRADRGLISDEDFRNGMANKLGLGVDDWRKVVLAVEQPDTELLDYVKGLRKTYKTAILSNANHGTLDRKIGPELLQACFDVVMVSAEVGLIKPDPQIYRLTAERLGVEPSECVFIDDIEPLVDGARAVGMQGILYKDFEQLRAELDALLANSKS
jgi:epoxide hydrolase-like predicted phosphatase